MVCEEVWVEKEVEKELPPSPTRFVRAPSVPLKPAGKASTSKGIATFTMDDAEDDEDGPKKGKGKGKAAKEAKPKADKKAAGMASMMSFFGKK